MSGFNGLFYWVSEISRWKCTLFIQRFFFSYLIKQYNELILEALLIMTFTGIFLRKFPQSSSGNQLISIVICSSNQKMLKIISNWELNCFVQLGRIIALEFRWINSNGTWRCRLNKRRARWLSTIITVIAIGPISPGGLNQTNKQEGNELETWKS